MLPRFYRDTQLWFPLSALKTLFRLAVQSSFRSLEMHSDCKRRHKICFCSVILGQLESFRTPDEPSTPALFSQNFRCNLKFDESENFSDSFLDQIFESENFRFSFPTKNNLTWGTKWERLNFRRNSYDKLRNFYMNGKVIWKF